jgi:hypothetical protein
MMALHEGPDNRMPVILDRLRPFGQRTGLMAE